jgi:putative transposase
MLYRILRHYVEWVLFHEIVQDPGEYRWSSYRNNGLGQADPRITAHPVYLALDRDVAERQAAC